MADTKLWLTAEEVMDFMQISRSSAYRLIKILNDELSAKGYLIIPGRANAAYFRERLYTSTSAQEVN